MTQEMAAKIEAYRRSIAIAREMLLRGIISKSDYAEIDTMLVKKHGLSLGTIFS